LVASSPQPHFLTPQLDPGAKSLTLTELYPVPPSMDHFTPPSMNDFGELKLPKLPSLHVHSHTLMARKLSMVQAEDDDLLSDADADERYYKDPKLCVCGWEGCGLEFHDLLSFVDHVTHVHVGVSLFPG
jgi:hypothetical protein